MGDPRGSTLGPPRYSTPMGTNPAPKSPRAGFLELVTDDIVWTSDPRFPGGGRHVGKENVRRWLRQLCIYDEVSIDVEEIIDLDGRALGITQFHGASVGAPPVDWTWCHLVAFRDGLISEAQSFLDRAEALKAAGLSEWRCRSRTRISCGDSMKSRVEFGDPQALSTHRSPIARAGHAREAPLDLLQLMHRRAAPARHPRAEPGGRCRSRAPSARSRSTRLPGSRADRAFPRSQ